MHLFVQGNELHTFQVLGNETVADVKALVEEAEGFSAEDLSVVHCGKPLENDQLLSALEAETTLTVFNRMLGGKVHGSLARAGKVRGQTPKVDKQEKKKAKTGRAKRRMQYNRRFVSVVQTFGRRRGPNANT